MVVLKIFVVCSVALFASYASSAPSTDKAVGKTVITHYKLPKKIISTSLSYNGTHIVYAICSDSDSKNNCRLTLDRLDSTGKSRSCNVTAKISTKDRPSPYDVYYSKVELLENNRALVMTEHDGKIKFTNVNFYDCNINEVELASSADQIIFNYVGSSSVAPYENSYDVFFANSKLCQELVCRMSFDNDGKVMKDAVAWGDRLMFVMKLGDIKPVAHRSPINGFIVSQSYIWADDAITDSEGNRILTVRTPTDQSAVTVSVVGKKIFICMSSWIDAPSPINFLPKLECKQYDLQGKFVKTELEVITSSLVGDEKHIISLARLNLPEGFILFATLCLDDDKYYDEICPGHEKFFVYRFDGNGKTLKAVEINDFQCENEFIAKPLSAFQNEAGESCVQIYCKNRGLQVDKLTSGVRCFTQDEL